MEFLFNLIIQPLCLLFEFIFDIVCDFSKNVIFSIFFLSFAVSILCLPLQSKVRKLQEEEKEIQKKLAKKVNDIKKNFKGDERFFLLKTYYKQNNYKPIMALRNVIGILFQIPIFLAACIFFLNLQLLDGCSAFIFSDLSKPDSLLRVANVNINLAPFVMTIINLIVGNVYLKDKEKKEKRFLYITSFVFLVLLYNSPVALVLYWTFNNLFSLIKNLCFKFMGNIKSEFKDILPEFNYKKIFFLTAIGLCVLIGLFVPSSILSTSPYEFMFDDSTPNKILSCVFISSIGIFLFWGSVVYWVLGTSFKKIYVLILNLILFSSVFHLLAYKMPSASLANTLSFNAYKVDFGGFNKFYLFATVLILIFLIFLVIKNLFLKKIKVIEKMIAIVIITCTLVSFSNACKMSFKTKAYLLSKKTEEKLKNNYINLSKTKKNVLIIFADRAIASYIPIIFQEKPELYGKYIGFTYYPNTLSFAQYTLLGYPPVLGGYEYTPVEINNKKGLFEQKFAQAITMLPAIFSLNNWDSKVVNPINEGWEAESWGGVTKREVDILAQSNLYDKFGITTDVIPDSISDDIRKEVKVSSSVLTKRNLICYSVLSILPLNLRQWFYDNGLYHNPNNNTDINYSKKFLKAYAELYNLSKITDFSAQKNTFVVFNSSLTHNPSLLKYPNYEISLFNVRNYISPMEKSLNLWSLRHYHVNMAFVKFLGDYFDFLRKNNVYDNTRIIIVSDHGISYGLQNPYLTAFEQENYMPYNALLMVKDFNQKNKIKINTDFMTNADVPYIATKNVIKNPKNPFSAKVILNKNSNDAIIKADTNWQPSYYLGKEKILNDKTKFNYVKEDPLKEKNWIINAKLRHLL